MTENQKRKLQGLKSINAKYAEQLQWKDNILLQDCLKVLEKYRIISNETELNSIMNIANGADVVQVSHAAKPSLTYNHTYYIVWNNAHTPMIECTGINIMAQWDNVMAVDFDTCFVDKVEQNAILVRG